MDLKSKLLTALIIALVIGGVVVTFEKTIARQDFEVVEGSIEE